MYLLGSPAHVHAARQLLTNHRMSYVTPLFLCIPQARLQGLTLHPLDIAAGSRPGQKEAAADPSVPAQVLLVVRLPEQ
jgi:hypothetical protein